MIVSDMMNQAFLSPATNPTMFMAEYLLNLNETNVNDSSLRKIATMKSELVASKVECANLKSQVRCLQERYDALYKRRSPKAAVKDLNFDLSLSETSDDDEVEEIPDSKNNQPEKEVKDELAEKVETEICTFLPALQQSEELIQQKIAIESELTAEPSQEMLNLQPTPSFYNVELLTTLENPVIRYDYNSGSIQWNNFDLKDDEQSDHSEKLQIFVPEPCFVSSSASREIEAAVKSLELETENSSRTYEFEIEDSLKNLFGSEETAELKINSSEAIMLEDVEQMLAAADHLLVKGQQIESVDFNGIVNEAVSHVIEAEVGDTIEVKLDEIKESESEIEPEPMEIETKPMKIGTELMETEAEEEESSETEVRQFLFE